MFPHYTDPDVFPHTVRVQIIVSSSVADPSGLHGSVIAAAKIIPGSVDIVPTGLHLTVYVKIVPRRSDYIPSSEHRSASVKVIPGGTHLHPAGMHRS